MTYAFVYFRMTFNGSPNLPTWCNFSEMVVDLANEISLCKDWDPSESRSPDQPVTPKPKRLNTSIPHVPAREMAAVIPALEAGKVDVFIDDLIDAFPTSPENLAQKPHVVPPEDACPQQSTTCWRQRTHPEASDPLDDETARRRIPSRATKFLGWLLDARRLLVSLPDDEYSAWTETIAKVIRVKGCTKGDLDTLEGQFTQPRRLCHTPSQTLPCPPSDSWKFKIKQESTYKVDRTCPSRSQPLDGATPLSKRGDLIEPSCNAKT